MGKSGAGQQTATIEQIRFITPELATVDGSWIVTGARDATGKELPVMRGRGFELVQKKNGNWKFIATREMVIFGEVSAMKVGAFNLDWDPFNPEQSLHHLRR
jgi:hypothetical protein